MLPAAKCYSCLRVFCSTRHGVQPPVMASCMTQTLTLGGMHDGSIRLWRTDDTFAAALSGARVPGSQGGGGSRAALVPPECLCVAAASALAPHPPPPSPTADLLGLQNCDGEGSQHGGSKARDAMAAAKAAAAETTGSPGMPPLKRVRLELPANLASAAAAAVATGDYQQLTDAAAAVAGPDCGCCVSPDGRVGNRIGSAGSLQRLASQAAVPALSVSRLERELEKALRAFIRIK